MTPFLYLTALVLILSCAAFAQADDGPVTSGLVLHYDMAAGSAPGEDGLVRDLSGNGRHGMMRPASAAMPATERTGWLPHHVRQGDDGGGWVWRPARRQVLKQPGSDHTMPFGLVHMDNGEIALICSWERRGQPTRPIIAFSRDGGDTWTDFHVVPGAGGRPINLTYHGGGTLSFVTGRRYYSHDYGRTWPENVPHPPTSTGRTFHLEGNAWVDRDATGRATAILELGWHYAPGKRHPVDDATVVFRRSRDGGHTWSDEVAPPQWKFELTHKGKTWLRGVSEGAIVRAANGWLVAALRSDIPPHFLDGPHDDSLEGTAISISRDDGRTWSDMNILFYAGRHHANLQRMPNGDLVCVMIVRTDIADGKLASHRRGCDALVSHDHGLTWNLERRFELDAFDYLRPDYWVDGKCGHIGSVALPDGDVISAYGHYLPGAAVLVKWRPDAGPVLHEAPPAGAEGDATPAPTAYEQVAAPDSGYAVRRPDDGPAELALDGAAFIHVPLDAKLASLGPNGTIEVVLRLDDTSAMPVLLGCSGIGAAGPTQGFKIAWDLRQPDRSTQVIFSDQRASDGPTDYSVTVAAASTPTPYERVAQQLAYVLADGHGAFYRDGRRFSDQGETGAGAGSLFAWVVERAGGPADVRLAIGAHPRSNDAGLALRAGVMAVRIYDRPLSARELERNRKAALGW